MYRFGFITGLAAGVLGGAVIGVTGSVAAALYAPLGSEQATSPQPAKADKDLTTQHLVDRTTIRDLKTEVVRLSGIIWNLERDRSELRLQLDEARRAGKQVEFPGGVEGERIPAPAEPFPVPAAPVRGKS